MERVVGFWSWLTAGPRGLVAWIHAAFCALTTEDGRKGWAMLAALGCCVVMTGEVASVMWMVRANTFYEFILGLSAQLINFLVVTGLMVLLGVRRKTALEIPLPGGGKMSLGIDDSGQPVVVQTTPVPTAPSPPAPVGSPQVMGGQNGGNAGA
jgi:hypothetical protein